jgi:hypothetical protein
MERTAQAGVFISDRGEGRIERSVVSGDAEDADKSNGRAARGTDSRRRRELLTGTAVAVGGVITGAALAGATPARADQGSAVLLGQDNTGATAPTGLFTTGSESAVLANPFTRIGVQGTGSESATGVQGTGGPTNGNGVTGFGAGGGSGVVGTGGPDAGSGVSGFGAPGSFSAHGVEGTGVGQGSGVIGGGGNTGGPGVVGFAATHSNGNGVVGSGAGSGCGVVGVGGAEGGDGVTGFSSSTGGGVVGRATSAAAVGVRAEEGPGGTALKATGRTVFSNSGIVTVAAGSAKVTKTGVSLVAGSLVLATLQQDVPGVWVRSAVPNVAGHSFTVHLSKASPVRVKIAWFVVN